MKRHLEAAFDLGRFSATGSLVEPAIQRVVYSDVSHVIRFSLDVRDGYLDATVGRRRHLDVGGNLIEPAQASAGSLVSIYAVLKGDGIVLPDAMTGLYEPDVLDRSVEHLVEGIQRHPEIFND